MNDIHCWNRLLSPSEINEEYQRRAKGLGHYHNRLRDIDRNHSLNEGLCGVVDDDGRTGTIKNGQFVPIIKDRQWLPL